MYKMNFLKMKGVFFWVLCSFLRLARYFHSMAKKQNI